MSDVVINPFSLKQRLEVTWVYIEVLLPSFNEIAEDLTMTYTLNMEPTDEDIASIRNELRKYNTPFLQAVRDQELTVSFSDEQQQQKGGIVGRVRGNWLLINFLWVDDMYRGQGVGSQLLKEIEQQAVKMGCHSVMLDTLSFQARPFYERHGYQCQMSLDNYPVDGQLHFLTKSLL